jgi:hypothetical protein
MATDHSQYGDPLIDRIVNATPHHFPPNCGYKMVRKIEGDMVKLAGPLQPMNNEAWSKYRCDTVDYVMIMVEVTPGGKRDLRKEDGKPRTMTLKQGHGDLWKYRFAKCMLCWKIGNRHFGDPTICPFPYDVSVNHPAIPRLGVCGCVICNGCIADAKDNKEEKVTPCPYCGRGDSFFREIKIWPISKEHSLTADFKKVSTGGRK